MKKKIVFIQFCIVLIISSVNVKGQNASLNKALEISYYNFLRTVPDRWKDKFDRKDFYLVNNYNPYGFNVQRIKGWNHLYLNPSLTPIIVESCYYYTFSVLAMDSVSYKFLFF